MINCMNSAPPAASARDFKSSHMENAGSYDEEIRALLALKLCIFTEESGSGFKGRRGVPGMNLYVISVFIVFLSVSSSAILFFYPYFQYFQYFQF